MYADCDGANLFGRLAFRCMQLCNLFQTKKEQIPLHFRPKSLRELRSRLRLPFDSGLGNVGGVAVSPPRRDLPREEPVGGHWDVGSFAPLSSLHARPLRKHECGLDWLWLCCIGRLRWSSWLCKSRQCPFLSCWSPLWWVSRIGCLSAVNGSKEYLAFSGCIGNPDCPDGNEIL